MDARGFSLRFSPWNRQLQAVRLEARYRAHLELTGVPAHACNKTTASIFLGSAAWVEHLGAASSCQDDLGRLHVVAWTDDLGLLPRAKELLIEEPHDLLEEDKGLVLPGDSPATPWLHWRRRCCGTSFQRVLFILKTCPMGGALPGREAMAMTVMGTGLGGIVGVRARGTLPATARTGRTTADGVDMTAATEGAAGVTAALWTSGMMAALRTGGAMTRVAAGGHPVGAR
jgi:hypothetical protein